MSETNCNACNELRRTSPEFVMNGVTDTVAASLKNNTGFNPALTALHTNCEDLNDANDCLIARMDSEVEAYEVCDWKEFMHKYLPNNYEVLKAIIAGDCGQWGRLNALETRIGDLCVLLRQQMQGYLEIYGERVGKLLRDDTAKWGGEILRKDSIPAAAPNAEVGDHDSLGIEYQKLIASDCDGVSKTYEWIRPRIHCFTLASNIAYNDVIWRVDVNTAKGWGLTDTMLEWLRVYPQWWPGFGNGGGLVRNATIRLDVTEGYLRMIYYGSTGDMQNWYIDASTTSEKLIIS